MPIGFNKQPVSRRRNNYDDDDPFEDSSSIEDIAPQKRPNKTKSTSSVSMNNSGRRSTTKTDQTGPTGRASREQDDDFDDSEDDIDNKKSNTKKIAIAGIAVLGVAALAITIISFSKDTEEPEQVATVVDNDSVSTKAEDSTVYVYDDEGNPVYTEDNVTVDPDAIFPGDNDYEGSLRTETTPTVYGADDFLKDINGVDIAAVYNVASRDYVYDYVSYKSRRGIIDEGMEVYWLEVTYEGKKYRIQVPFYFFKDFGEEGICRVQIEVLNIEGGGKVISYMQVVEDSAGRNEE